MAGMPNNAMPWWRWRSRIRSALHMLSDQGFQQQCWLAGQPGYGDVTDAVYRIVEDSWLDYWSAERYVGSVIRDTEEAKLVDAAVFAVLQVLHEVGADAPAGSYLGHPRWPEVLSSARAAHVAMATADGDDPQESPRSLELLAIWTDGVA